MTKLSAPPKPLRGKLKPDDTFPQLPPEEKIRICEEIASHYPDNHPEKKKIREQIKNYSLTKSIHQSKLPFTTGQPSAASGE